MSSWIHRFVFSVLALTVSSGVDAATCVPATPDGAGLQSCLDSTDPGDTILLSPGTYVPIVPVAFGSPGGETFFINKRLTLRGMGPGVVLSGDLGSGHRAFNVVMIDTAADPGLVTLEGLTIQDGDSSAGGFFVGGGIVAGSNQTVTLNDVDVQNNTAFHAGGVWLGGGPGSLWTINASRFLNNSASDSGGAIRAQGTQLLSINGTLFDGNHAGGFAGGALHFTSFGSLAVNGATFTNNTSGESGGAIAIQGVGFGQSYSVSNSTFVENAAVEPDLGFGGAIDIFSIVQDGTISNSTFYGNTATVGGGAVYISRGHSTLAANTFRENSSDFLAGAVGIQGDESAAVSTNVTLKANIFEDNSSVIGGAVFGFNVSSVGSSRPSGLTFNKNHFRRNIATIVGGTALLSGENLSITKDHYNFNLGDDPGFAGGLAIFDFTSGSLSKVHFNHNDNDGVADSLRVDGSPSLTLSQIMVAGEDENDCLINGSSLCP